MVKENIEALYDITKKITTDFIGEGKKSLTFFSLI